MAKRSKRDGREPVATTDYADAEGNMLTLRESISAATIRKIEKAQARGAGTVDDDWHRRTELLFERLAVRWVIAELPIEDQAMLLARYRMADPGTQRWVRRTIADHVERHVPELGSG